MTNIIRQLTCSLTVIGLTLVGLTDSLSAQSFNRLIDQNNYGRYVDLKRGYGPSGVNYQVAQNYGARPVYGVADAACRANGGYNTGYANTGYASPYVDYGNNFGAAAFPPTLPISNRAIRPGGCYAGQQPGYPAPYPIGANYPGYTGQYPYWTANGRYGAAFGDEYVGSNLFGAPTRFDRDEPVRNIFRWLLP